jgi:hypothetical protein
MNVNFLMHPEFFIFDRMTKKERELYKEASLVKTNNKIIVQKFRVQFTHACIAESADRIERAGPYPRG